MSVNRLSDYIEHMQQAATYKIITTARVSHDWDKQENEYRAKVLAPKGRLAFLHDCKKSN